MGSIETVKSKDGTVIAFERRGEGPPLVMVHGTTVDHTRWGPVVGKLAERFSLFLVDRRGRGLSGDGPVYSIEREFEDVVAVLEAAPSPAAVLGHSYGAICALEAARLTPRIAKMVLYEPPLPLPGRAPPLAPDLGRRLEGLLAQNDRVGLVEAFLREVVHMGERQIARLRHSSSWPVHLAAAHTVPREVMTAGSYQFRAEALANVRVPTLFLLGGQSPPALQEATRSAARALAGSEIAVMPGQGHVAMSTGPASLLDRVIPFLEGR